MDESGAGKIKFVRLSENALDANIAEKKNHIFNRRIKVCIEPFLSIQYCGLKCYKLTLLLLFFAISACHSYIKLYRCIEHAN